MQVAVTIAAMTTVRTATLRYTSVVRSSMKLSSVKSRTTRDVNGSRVQNALRNRTTSEPR